MIKRGIKYYNSADIMPIGRYMMAICRDLKYFAIGDKLPNKINKKQLSKAIEEFNKTILKNSDQKEKYRQLGQLSKDEGNIYLQSVLVVLIDYCNKLIEAGTDKDKIQLKLAPIKHLLVERGLTPDSKKNAARLTKVSRNFKIKSDAIKNMTRNADAESNKVYESYLRNLVIIEKAYGIKINEHHDSVNKYVLLLDELNKTRTDGNRSKSNAKPR